jgi:aspartyl-tRNA(Asn)/glutamyl-tRNA(Gln) amidotransferase subunit C
MAVLKRSAQSRTQRRDNTATLVNHGFSASLTMSLTTLDIQRIANLARLALHPEEEARMLDKINNFFGIVEQISAVDTTGVIPMAHPVDAMRNSPEIALRLRADTVSEPNQREINQRSAPAVEKGLFLVPKVIE